MVDEILVSVEALQMLTRLVYLKSSHLEVGNDLTVKVQ